MSKPRSWGDCVLRELMDSKAASSHGWSGMSKGEVLAVKPMRQRGRKGSPGGLGKHSGFILNEMEVTGLYKMSMCGGHKHYTMEK